MTLPLFSSGPLTDAPAPELRPYQERAVRLARMHAAAGKRRILLTLPTGGGKMVITAAIIRSSTVPVLFVCHRMELVEQCVEQLARLGITNIGVMRGNDERENSSASIQVASIQTLARRPKPPAGLVIIDEAHRSLADSYVDHVFNAYPEAIILGFTASPIRGDGKPMGNLWEVLETVCSYSDLFKRPDWLLAPDVYGAPATPDLSSLRIKHGDYEETALGEVMSQKHLVGNLLDHWLALASKHPVYMPENCIGKRTAASGLGVRVPGETTTGRRRRTFIFAVNILHSKLICERFSAAGVRIAHLDGTTPEDERRAMLAAIRKGELECISSCNVLLEGVDAPEVKCVLHARPTKSLVLWLQSCGRIFRPWREPGSQDYVRPLILDHADNWSEHGAPHGDRVWSLTNVVGWKKSAVPYKVCPACFAHVNAGLSVCPYCKTVFVSQPRELPRETDAALVLRAQVTPESVRREFFDRMSVLARLKAFKPGYASAKYKEHYGDWPPREWSDELKLSFSSDADWQKRLEQRLRSKEKEDNAWDAAVAPPPERPQDTCLDVGDDPWKLVVGFDTYEDGAETFSAWTRKEFPA